MYSVSADYLTALASPVAKFRLSGTIGSTPFTDDNVLMGSFSINNNVSEGYEIKLGSVYIGQLKATFTGLNIARGEWVGKVITISEGLLTYPDTDTYEDVPLGVFKIAEANHTLKGVEVVAYDAMSDLDTLFSIDQTYGEPYALLTVACTACGVTLANTQAQIEALPNGTETLYIYPENDIGTWRDLISWIAQTLASVATINRSGALELRQYSTTSAMSIDESHRFSGCTFSDFTVKYTGASCVLIEENSTRYTFVEPDDGLTYNLGTNPFLQGYGTEALQQEIIDDLSAVQLVPFSAQMLGGAIFDLCDCLTFTGGVAAGAVCGVMGYSYTYNGGYKVEGYGSNPALANAKSKTDKDIIGLMSRVADEIMYYDFVNASAIHIGDGETKNVIDIRYVTVKDTHIDFHAEIKHTNDAALKITATYLLNGETYYYQPEQVEESGVNLLHLLLPFKVNGNVLGRLIVQLTADGGGVDILSGEALAYLAGYGMGAGELPWDGNIDAQDEWTNILIPSIPFDEASVTDNASVSFITPTAITLAETFQNVPIPSIAFDENGVTDAVTVAFVILSAIIDTNSTVVRDATYTTIASGQFVLQTEYMESSVTEVIDSGYCTKVTPFVTGLTVSDVEIV